MPPSDRSPAILALAATCLLASLASASPPADSPSRPLVGVNYFAGWWEPSPNKWQESDGRDWRPKFPGRVPLLGAYNTQDTMDREIAAAADHGVDFFAILWYAADPAVKLAPHAERLNIAVEQFMRSPNAGRMKFMIEFCNHKPFGITDDAKWDECVGFWTRCMNHPSYLRAAGRPVFKIHGGSAFLEQNGKDRARSKARLDQLRAAARNAGAGEPLLGCGVGPGEAIPRGHWAAQLFDFTACYMAVPPLPASASDSPYHELAQFIAAQRPKHATDAVPHLPFAAAGWNPRPWAGHANRPAFALPTRDEWTAALRAIRADLDSGAFGLPLPGGRVQPAFTLYAWNEFGEGGIVAPTRGEQHMKLEAIRDVFGSAN